MVTVKIMGWFRIAILTLAALASSDLIAQAPQLKTLTPAEAKNRIGEILAHQRNNLPQTRSLSIRGSSKQLSCHIYLFRDFPSFGDLWKGSNFAFMGVKNR